MRKVLLVICGITLLFVIGVYLLVPATLRIAEAGVVSASFPAAKRFIFEKQNWHKWSDPESFLNHSHEITNTFFTKTDIMISNKDGQYQTSLRLIPLNIDSTGIEWEYTLPTGNNPFTRIGKYMQAKRLKMHMDSVMLLLVNFLNDKDRVYGTAVRKEQLPDRPLLSRYIVLNREPTPADTYELLSKVQEQARLQNDSAIGPAMKYSARIDSTRFELMVAIPTSRMLKTNGDYVAKGLVGGNLIATEVHGGESELRKAWKGLEEYKADHRLSSPAIPFEEMRTDRTKEKDSSKWITKIYYPIRF